MIADQPATAAAAHSARVGHLLHQTHEETKFAIFNANDTKYENRNIIKQAHRAISEVSSVISQTLRPPVINFRFRRMHFREAKYAVHQVSAWLTISRPRCPGPVSRAAVCRLGYSRGEWRGLPVDF